MGAGRLADRTRRRGAPGVLVVLPNLPTRSEKLMAIDRSEQRTEWEREEDSLLFNAGVQLGEALRKLQQAQHG